MTDEHDLLADDDPHDYVPRTPPPEDTQADRIRRIIADCRAILRRTA